MTRQKTHQIGRFGTTAASLLAVTLVAGCQLTPTPIGGDDLERIETELAALETLATSTQETLQALNTQQTDQLNTVNKRLAVIDSGVKRVPTLITSACQSPEVVPVTCEEVTAQTIVNQDDKMVVGAAEHLWISPPGLHLTASIDTGASSNSIHATEVTPFERDGADWVRFTLTTTDDPTRRSERASNRRDQAAPKSVVVERKIVRLLKISKRPVVRLRVKLGNVLDSFEFILTNRGEDQHPVELGRNFLQDVALVDVGKQFVQPRFDNSNKKSVSGNASSGR